MCAVQVKRQLISTRMIMLAVLIIFLKGFVTDPIIRAIDQVYELSGTKYGLAFLQPFVCLHNSYILSLLLPLFFVMLIAGVPSAEHYDLFVHIRTNRKHFFASQVLAIVVLDMAFILLAILSSALPAVAYIDSSFDYCKAITRYNIFFPDRTGEYVTTLLPPNLYNQESFYGACVHSVFLIFLELMLFGMILLFFSMINIKFIGVVVVIVLTAISTIITNADIPQKWLFPTAHSTIWLHKDVLLGKEIFPMSYSYIYFIALIIAFLFLAALFLKKYECHTSR